MRVRHRSLSHDPAKSTIKHLYCFLWPCLALLCCLGSGRVLAAERIVSINLCTDQLLLLLAPTEDIRSVSFMAANPLYSAYVDRVGDIPLNHARVEEIVAFEPDLILAYELSDHRLVTLLRQLGYRVELVAAAESLEDVASVIADTAALLQQQAAGAELLAAMKRQLQAAQSLPPGPRPLAVIYAPNGYSPGSKTLQGAVLEAAGFANLSARLGNDYGAVIPLEQLLRRQPELFVIDDQESNMNSLAQKKLRHPALAKSIAAGAMARVDSRLWSCPTPMIAQAVAQLRVMR
jgi:iron complex transport system substrate-binding protein